MALVVALPTDAPALAPRVLGAGLEERQILVEDVLDAEEHVAEPRLAHQRRERVAARGDRGGHRLHEVVDIVKARGDDGAAERLEPRDVQA